MTDEEFHEGILHHLNYALHSFYRSGLFHYRGRNALILKDNLPFTLTFTLDSGVIWRDENYLKTYTTEEVLEKLPEEWQVKILFHLDLFKKIR